MYIIENLINEALKIGFNIDENSIEYEIGNRTPCIFIYGNNLHGNDIEAENLTYKIGAGRFSYMGGGIMGGISTSDELKSNNKELVEKYHKLLELFENAFKELEGEYLNSFDDDENCNGLLDDDGYVRI